VVLRLSRADDPGDSVPVAVPITAATLTSQDGAPRPAETMARTLPQGQRHVTLNNANSDPDTNGDANSRIPR
jgi:hypothetical protein